MSYINNYSSEIGNKYGKLKVLEYAGRTGCVKSRPSGYPAMLCLCDCGNNTKVRLAHLRSGETTSCGCYRNEVSLGAAAKANTTHGLRNHKHYQTWLSMISRCTNPNQASYNNYGAKGTGVCDEWLDSPVGFIEWVEKEAPSEHSALRRIDNNKDYSPENCVFEN